MGHVAAIRRAAQAHVAPRHKCAEEALKAGLTLWVPGTPHPQPRPRARRGPRNSIIVANPKGPASVWKRVVCEHVMAVFSGRGPTLRKAPLDVTLDFLLQRPPSHLKLDGGLRKDVNPYPIGANTGDLDNLEKSTLDGIERSGLIHNDAQVVALSSRKTYAEGDETTGCLIEVALYQP